MLLTPCYQCPDRVVGCHATCERYLAMKKRDDARNKEIAQGKEADSFLVDSMYRVSKKSNRRV